LKQLSPYGDSSLSFAFCLSFSRFHPHTHIHTHTHSSAPIARHLRHMWRRCCDVPQPLYEGIYTYTAHFLLRLLLRRATAAIQRRRHMYMNVCIHIRRTFCCDVPQPQYFATCGEDASRWVRCCCVCVYVCVSPHVATTLYCGCGTSQQKVSCALRHRHMCLKAPPYAP